jgi:hypothetical protein
MAKLRAFAIVLLTSGCTEGQHRTPTTPGQKVAQDFAGQVLEIAQTYESYGASGTEVRITLTWCADAGALPPVKPGFSVSGDAATHGRKMYWLFIKEKPNGFLLTGSYTEDGKPSPVGQVVVKEAWIPEEVEDDGQKTEPVLRTLKVRGAGPGGRPGEVKENFLPYARSGGRLYHAKEKAGLFVMLKLDPQTPGTDEGWVYGTVTADGKKVTSAGRVESCMGCHKGAPHDRLFGLAH